MYEYSVLDFSFELNAIYLCICYEYFFVFSIFFVM